MSFPIFAFWESVTVRISADGVIHSSSSPIQKPQFAPVSNIRFSVSPLISTGMMIAPFQILICTVSTKSCCEKWMSLKGFFCASTYSDVKTIKQMRTVLASVVFIIVVLVISALSQGILWCTCGTGCTRWRFCVCVSRCSLPLPSGRLSGICRNGCICSRRNGCAARRSGSSA